MIVDLHTRIWNAPTTLGDQVAQYLRRHKAEPWSEIDTGSDAFEAAMAPVSLSVIHGFESALLGATIDLDAIAGHVQRDPQRRLGFAGIDPTQPGATSRLERAVELGLVGVTLSPSAQGFHPAHSNAMALYEACQAKGLPVFFESLGPMASSARLEYDQPVLLDEIARAFPNLKIILSSAGDPFIDQTLALLAKHPTVFTDLGGLITRPWALYTALVRAAERGVIGQLLFASSYPLGGPEQAIVTLYSLNTYSQGTQLPNLPREQVRSIVERDTLDTLGLSYPEGFQAGNPPNPDPIESYTVVGKVAG